MVLGNQTPRQLLVRKEWLNIFIQMYWWFKLNVLKKSIIYRPLSSKRACTQQGSKLRSDSSLCIFFQLLCMCLPSAGAKFRNGIYVAHHFSNSYFTKNKIHAKESHIKKKPTNSTNPVCLDFVLMNKTAGLKIFFQDQAFSRFVPGFLNASSSHWISQAPSTCSRGRIQQLSLTLMPRLSWNRNIPQWDRMPAKTTLSHDATSSFKMLQTAQVWTTYVVCVLQIFASHSFKARLQL